MMDVPRPWRLLDPAALSFRALPIVVMAAMVEMTEEEMVVLVVALLVVEAETVAHHHPEEGMGASAAAAIVHATTVVKEATLPEIVLTNQQVMQGRAVVAVEEEEEVRATATTVASLGILQGTAPQQPVPRRWKQFSIHSKRRRGNSSFRAEAVVHCSGWVGIGFGVISSPSSLCKYRVEKPYVISLFNVLGCSFLGRKMGYYPFGNLQGSFFVACFLDLSRDNVFFVMV